MREGGEMRIPPRGLHEGCSIEGEAEPREILDDATDEGFAAPARVYILDPQAKCPARAARQIMCKHSGPRMPQVQSPGGRRRKAGDQGGRNHVAAEAPA